MAKPKIEKRPLKLSNLDEILAEVNRLQSNGYQSKGNWNLAQTCNHLADWMRFPMDGFPVPPAPIRFMMWIMNITVGGRMKRNILANGFSPGMPTAPETAIQAHAMTEQAAIEKLASTIQRVKDHSGDLKPSPLFGPMDKETLIKVSLLHAEHHLGYLE